MTNDPTSTVQDDIAFMRSLAESGRNSPLLSGPIMVAAGLIFGTATLVHWAIATGLIQTTPWAIMGVWLASAAVFTVTLSVLIRRMASQPGYSSSGNKAVGAAWSGIGFSIFAFWAALMAAGFATGNWDAMNAMPIVVAAVYGAAWFVAGEVARSGWMKGVAILSYAGAVLLGLFWGSANALLVYAGLLIAVTFIPGLVLMRQEGRSAV